MTRRFEGELGRAVAERRVQAMAKMNGELPGGQAAAWPRLGFHSDRAECLCRCRPTSRHSTAACGKLRVKSYGPMACPNGDSWVPFPNYAVPASGQQCGQSRQQKPTSNSEPHRGRNVEYTNLQQVCVVLELLE